MKKTLLLLISLLPCMYCVAADKTLNIQVGNVTYLIPASAAAEMVYDNGTTLTVMGKSLMLSDIGKMYVDATAVVNNEVVVTYSGSQASVTVAGNIAKYLSVDVNSAQVRINQDDTLADEITYTLTGSSSNGSFYTEGSKKITLNLNSLVLTCADSAAVNIRNGKRIALNINGNNTLTDAENGTQKACLAIKGHVEVGGTGTLTLNGNTAHALKTNEYMQLTNAFTGSIIVKSAAKDGLHIGQYLQMDGGTLKVESCGDDGIQIEKTDDSTDELNGQAIINAGTISISVSADAGKGLKSDSLITITGGTFDITTTGNGVTGTNDTTSACACIKAGYDMVVKGGTFTLKSTGTGGKGISVDGNLTISGGEFNINTTGTRYSSSNSGGGGWWAPSKNNNAFPPSNESARIASEGHFTPDGQPMRLLDGDNFRMPPYQQSSLEHISRRQGPGGGGWGGDNSTDSYKRSSPKGIKADGDILINGGNIKVSVTGQADGSEGIETKKTFTITDGYVEVYSYDDAINSKSHMYVQGGNISAIATNNDGLDSNGNMYIRGGEVMAFGGKSPECGLDAAEQCYLYITGGNVLAVGGGNNSVSSTTGSQALVSTSGTVTANTTIKVTANKSTTSLHTFTIPNNYTSPSDSGGSWHMPSAGPGGGSSGMAILISVEGMASGSKYDVYNNSTSATTLTATNTYSGR